MTEKGNYIKTSSSFLGKLFKHKRMSRQRINAILRGKHAIERFDLITLLFLIYATDKDPDGNLPSAYDYVEEINQILEECNMMDIYPVNPYESFILMCLWSDDPLGTYGDVWAQSFDLTDK